MHLSLSQADVDFVFDVVIMTLDPSSNMLCFNVTILEDDRPETTKFFNISVIPEDPELVSSRQEITVAIGPTDEPPTPSLSQTALAVYRYIIFYSFELYISYNIICCS